jgi:glutaredoxin
LKQIGSSPPNAFLVPCRIACEDRSCFAMKITLYRKSGCPWAAAVIGFLNQLDLSHEVRNVTDNAEFAAEVQKKSGQCKSPTLDIDGHIIADASVEDVANFLEQRGVHI